MTYDANGKEIPITIDDEIDSMAKVGRKFLSAEVQIVLRERYETTFGITNHDHPIENQGFALIRHTRSEDSMYGSLLRQRIKQFVDLDIGAYTHQDLGQFLAMPKEYIEEVLRAVRDKASKKGKAIDEVTAQLDQLGGKP